METGDRYQAQNTENIVGELFSGKLTTSEALQKLRTRLIDLSQRNRLLNYKHPKGRSIQFVDFDDVNVIFDRLLDHKPIYLKPVPEPDPLLYSSKRPDARQYAEELGISTSLELNPLKRSNGRNRRNISLQTLFYPAELDRLCRKIASQSRMSIEETGANVLYLIIGFLTFYDKEYSEIPLSAPLLCIPVALNRAEIDPQYRTYRYNITFTGEDITENISLREKLRHDFTIHLPELDDEDTPDLYLNKIHDVIRTKPRWKVRRSLSLAMLSFGKLAIWSDLDPQKSSTILKHPILKLIFEGGSQSSPDSIYGEDYDIDNHRLAELPIIYDADSSQHSAIIDVLDGKNLVINGPPGTGKSQTITNIIAAAISKGKKVLFVSEKLAALEVVRNRLDQAHLGHFCLELHSHRTQKKKVLEDIQERLSLVFQPQKRLTEKLSHLRLLKKDLRRYTELLEMRVGNELNLSIYEIFGATEKRRIGLNETAAKISTINLSDAPNWSHNDLIGKNALVNTLTSHYLAIGNYGPDHPWWGYSPRLLSPGDDLLILTILNGCAEDINILENLFYHYIELFNLDHFPTFKDIFHHKLLLSKIVKPPDNLISSLLPRFFPDKDPKGNNARRVLSSLSDLLSDIRNIRSNIDYLSSIKATPNKEILFHLDKYLSVFSHSTLNQPHSHLNAVCDALNRLIDDFNIAYKEIDSKEFTKLDRQEWVELVKLLDSSKYKIKNIRIEELHGLSQNINNAVNILREDYAHIVDITDKYQLPFNGDKDGIQRIRMPSYFTDILPGIIVDESIIESCKNLHRSRYARLPLSEIKKLHDNLIHQLKVVDTSISHIEQVFTTIGYRFDGSLVSTGHLPVLVDIASSAPFSLLNYRRRSYESHNLEEQLTKAEQSQLKIRRMRNDLESFFYLKNLPDKSLLEEAFRTFRVEDNIFRCFKSSWRKAKRLYKEISKEKHRLTPKEYADNISKLLTWVNQRDAYRKNSDYKEYFGDLFRGTKTDYNLIRQLYAWYQNSNSMLFSSRNLSGIVDINEYSIDKLKYLANNKISILQSINALVSASRDINNILGITEAEFADLDTWHNYINNAKLHLSDLNTLYTFYRDKIISSATPESASKSFECRFALTQEDERLRRLCLSDKYVLDNIGAQYSDILFPIEFTACDNYYCELDSLGSYLQSLHQILSKHIHPTNKISDSINFLKAKTDLDRLISRINPIDQIEAVNWDQYIAAISNVHNQLSSICATIKEYSDNDISISTLISGLKLYLQERDILIKIEDNLDIKEILGEHYEQYDTNIESLESTYGWGKNLIISNLQNHILRLLINPQAESNYVTANRLHEEIVSSIASLKSNYSKLNDFGIYDWDLWHESTQNKGDNIDLDQAKSRLQHAINNIGDLIPWSRYIDCKKICENNGLSSIVDILERRILPPDKVVHAFEYVFYLSLGKYAYSQYPELARFSGDHYKKIRETYAEVDREIISLHGLTIAHTADSQKKISGGSAGARVRDLTEMQLIRHELSKTRRHIPIRQLIKGAPRTIQALKPCFMMGPLSVAQYLDKDAISFDLVLMDEASQLKPEDALGAVIRGAQVVVVGDPKQLPPTNFFERLFDSSDEEEEENAPLALSGMESILDICQQLFSPIRTLKWHYRSRHESLIAFSNFHFYRNNLIVFPSPYERNKHLGIRYHYVKNGIYQERKNILEAERLVDAVVDRMMHKQDESLGVVSLNLTQKELIEDLLDKRFRAIPECQNFISKWENEGWPFFVKNLENVQGDERDVIFISTTYGKAPNTVKVRQNFGPISRPEGWRRLNVLFTRARKKVELFSSMLPEDIIVDTGTPAGTIALHDYLEFARKGILKHNGGKPREPDSDFEIAVGDTLMGRGYPIVHQLGVAGFFIDIAVKNSELPGEYLAGIECDGASYHSSASIRDRDRIRQDILESLGWKDRLWRIWSTDWFSNPRRETEKLIEFLEARRSLGAKDRAAMEEQEDLFRTDESGMPQSPHEQDATIRFDDIDIYAEVGDQITYCFVDKPEEKKVIKIVEGSSNIDAGVSNENTPLAKALLGLGEGEEGELIIPNKPNRKITVIKISRGKTDLH